MIKINGVRWKLLQVSPSNPVLQMPNGSLALGCCNSINHIIYICKDLHETDLEEALIHEFTHAVIESYNIILTSREEETVVTLISSYGQEIAKLVQKALENKQEV